VELDLQDFQPLLGLLPPLRTDLNMYRIERVADTVAILEMGLEVEGVGADMVPAKVVIIVEAVAMGGIIVMAIEIAVDSIVQIKPITTQV
jgi:hypothetical protein